MEHEAFTSGNFDTHFVQNYFKPEVLTGELEGDEQLLAGVIADRALNNGFSSDPQHHRPAIKQGRSKWKQNRLR